jgi:hypothetical protein
MIIAKSASKEIRLPLTLELGVFPEATRPMERVNKQKQQARHNNKNKARTYLGGSFGSPSSFRYLPPVTPRSARNTPLLQRPTPSPDTMLESAAIMRSFPFLAGHPVKQCIPC